MSKPATLDDVLKALQEIKALLAKLLGGFTTPQGQ